MQIKYPPTLITTGDHDNRVAPWHSFKWAATRQEQGQNDNTFLWVQKGVGHGAGKPTEKIIEESANRYAFLVGALGPLKPKPEIDVQIKHENVLDMNKSRDWSFNNLNKYKS